MKQITILGILVCCGVSTSSLFSMSDKQKIEQLIKVVKSGDIKQVQQLLAEGVDVNAKSELGHTALMHAADKGNIELIKLLLRTPGIDVNIQNGFGSTALMWAIEKNQQGVVGLLLKAPGINVNLQDKGGHTALISAAKKGYKDIVTLLLKAPGIDVNIKKDFGGTTVFWWADADQELVRHLALYANKETLQTLPNSGNYILLDKNMQEFITWLQKGADAQALKVEEILKFTPIAFAMPALNDEFEKLVFLLGDKDYNKTFTSQAIQDALMTRNLPAFKILIPQAMSRKQSDLIQLILKELNKYVDQHPDENTFTSKLKTMLNEAALALKQKNISGKGAMQFSFK